MAKSGKIIFLDQKVGTLFQELAVDLSYSWPDSIIYTYKSDWQGNEYGNLYIKNAPSYQKKNIFTRFFSWLSYFICSFSLVLFKSRSNTLFIVTTPPYLGLIGLFFKKIRRQKYVVLVYDMYPDVLLSIGTIKDGVLTRLWRKMNRVVYNNADAVITIGEYMQKNLEKDFDVSKTRLKYIPVIHNWADTDWIVPLKKEENPFLKEIGMTDKFIVTYSGNIGSTHDIETIIEAINKLRDNDNIHFMFIGEGAKKKYVEDSKRQYEMDNLTILPFQPQSKLPFTLSASDLSLVSIGKGVEGFLVPSKFYSYLAAGTGILLISRKCEISDIIEENECGITIEPGDSDGLVEAILEFYRNPAKLQIAKSNSRLIAEESYSRKNTQDYIEFLKEVIN
ncbi:MAG: glycosyltransferase family 4 protein [Sedimentisphaeraceae bacterium JB056]